MPKYVRLGTGPHDLGAVWDLEQKDNLKGLVRANTGLIPHAIPLELIPMGKSFYKPGIIFFEREWDSIYSLTERPNWTEQDYFDYARQRFKKMGIKRP